MGKCEWECEPHGQRCETGGTSGTGGTGETSGRNGKARRAEKAAPNKGLNTGRCAYLEAAVRDDF